MKTRYLHKIITSALFAALTCIATMIIQIPSPMQGYINPGDCLVLLSGWMLGPIFGFCAAAIGSALADIFLSYVIFAPGTFVIKGLTALAAILLYRLFFKLFRGKKLPSLLASGILAELIMIFGYFAYEVLLYGSAISAATGIPGNIVQALFGIITGSMLFLLLDRIPQLKKIL